MQKPKGFTLIELLIVIGIIGILAAIIYVAVDPARRLAEARNAERWSSTNAVLNAILKYTVDNAGTMPSALTGEDTGTYVLGTGGTCSTCSATSTTGVDPCINLENELVPTYLSSIPQDPSNPSASDTQYYIFRSSAGRITVGACSPETVGGNTPVIRVSR